MFTFAKTIRSPCCEERSSRIGSTARQGPHQGAQKSTTTGVSAWRTSASKLSSVTSITRTMLQTARESGRAQGRHLPDRLEHDSPAHLGASHLAVDERDRHLEDAEAGADRAIRGLDLEGVPA